VLTTIVEVMLTAVVMITMEMGVALEVKTGEIVEAMVTTMVVQVALDRTMEEDMLVAQCVVAVSQREEVDLMVVVMAQAEVMVVMGVDVVASDGENPPGL